MWCWHLSAALAWATLLGPACSLRPCEQERLEATQMEKYGPGTNHALERLGLDAIYVVHYTKYDDRRIHFKEWLDSTGLQAYFITGWDREVATDKDVQCMWPSNQRFEQIAESRHFDFNWLEVRELTLAMKHASAWYQAAKHHHQYVLIFEDDAIFAPDFIPRFERALSNETVRNAFDILFLGSYGEDFVHNKPDEVRSDHGNKGGVGYVLSQSGAMHLLSTDPLLSGPADHLLSNEGVYPNPPPRRFALHPYPVWQGSRTKKQMFGRDASNRQFVWTPDLGPCLGRLCVKSPMFVSDHVIGDGDGVQEDSLRFVNGTALPWSAARAAYREERQRLPSLRRSWRLRRGTGWSWSRRRHPAA